MRAFAATLRLILAEKLLHLAMNVAPKNVAEGHDLVAAVHGYLVKAAARSSYQ